jgi:hypothetical protein
MEKRASKLKGVLRPETEDSPVDSTCTRCGAPRDREDRKYCPACRARSNVAALESVRNRRAENPNYDRDHNRKYREIRKAASPVGRAVPRNTYGLTHEELRQLYENQEGLCAICSKQICFECPALHKCPKRMHIDHDHKTDDVRGLLCSRCNQGIGYLKDSSIILRNAAGYLEAS